MEIKQVKDFVNSVVKQAIGETAVTATNLTGLIAMGDTVLSSETNVDAFNKTLIDRIGKTIISMRAYNSSGSDILMNTFDYGCILQKITVLPMDANDAPQWALDNGDTVDQYVIKKPEYKQKLFDGLNVWEIDITIPDYQLRTAFTSYEQMAAFIDSIFLSMRNSFELQLERTAEMAISNFIGEKIYAQTQPTTSNGLHCIHLLQEYNSETDGDLTAEAALKNLEFLKWASMTINKYVKRFAKMSKLFNVDGFLRFTPPEYVRIKMLQDFASAAAYYLQSDTYHNELTALPNYREVAYWQGSGQEYAYGETSLIDITTSSGNTVKQDGVVCLITDIEAIGMMADNRRLRSSPPNGKGEYTNYFQKADIRYYNDLSENGLVFTVTDTPYESA